MNLLPILLAALLSATLVSVTGSGYAQPSSQVPTGSVHFTGTAILKGSIANVQLDADGNPVWIQSGFWVLRLKPSEDGSDLPSTRLVARISMVGVDGTAMHGHTITNFKLNSVSIEGDTALVFKGTATITMRDGPVPSVPLAIKILNGAAIAMWIGPNGIDSHFSANPVYGTLIESSRTVAVEIREGMSVDERPGDSTGVALEKSSVNYYTNATGYLVQPRGETNLPAVVVIHEWWGLNQHIKDAADKLAAEGYVVLAADLYSSEVATVADRARELSGSVRNDPTNAINNLNAAVKHLSSLPNVNGSRIASLGWCFGGGQSLQLAINAETPLSATVVYYGNLVMNQTELGKIDWPVLGIFGSEDQSIPVDTVNQFQAALNAGTITNEIYIYEGVGHAFANPSGDNYAPEATNDSWEKTLAFLSKYV